MADILIRGMEMPVEQPVTLILDPSGRVWLPDTAPCKEYMAQELPPHGNLIDADSLADDLIYDAELAERALDDATLVGKERDYMQLEKDIKQNCAYYVSHATVIVPAERSDTNA